MLDPLDRLDPARRRAGGLASLFAAGQPGHWPGGYDPAGGRLWQASAGITGVTAAGEPVGLVLDLSQGGGNGPHLLNPPAGPYESVPAFVTGAGSPQTTAVVSGRVRTSVAGAVAGAVRCELRFPVETGQLYRLRLAANSNAGIEIPTGGLVSVTIAGTFVAPAGEGTQELFLRASGTGTAVVRIYPRSSNGASQIAGDFVEFAGCSVEAVLGNHAAQATALSRPTLALAAGRYHLSNDGGDSLPITLPAGTYGRATVDAAGAVVVDTVVNPANALAVQNQRDVVLRQGAFTAAEEAQIRAYWARYAV